MLRVEGATRSAIILEKGRQEGEGDGPARRGARLSREWGENEKETLGGDQGQEGRRERGRGGKRILSENVVRGRGESDDEYDEVVDGWMVTRW